MQIKHLNVIARIALKTARITASLDFFSSWGILRTLIWLLICRFSTSPFAWNHTGIDILCSMPFVFKKKNFFVANCGSLSIFGGEEVGRWGVDDRNVFMEANMHNLLYLSLLLSFIKILYPSSNSSVYTLPENGCWPAEVPQRYWRALSASQWLCEINLKNDLLSDHAKATHMTSNL